MSALQPTFLPKVSRRFIHSIQTSIYGYLYLAMISPHIHSEFIILQFYVVLSGTIAASLYKPYVDTGIYKYQGCETKRSRNGLPSA
jgi:hypothetical protein